MLNKTLPAAVTAGPDGAPEGTFEALVSTYSVDSIKDQVVPGAFGKTLADWQSSGNPIPIIWSHRHDDPFSHVGEVLQAEERAGQGLWVKGQLDMENPTGRQVYKLLKGGRVSQFSFAYDVEDSETADDGITQLKQLKLYEVGPTLIGMNQATRTLDVKTQPAVSTTTTTTLGNASMTITEYKAGRVLSAKNESDLKNAVELIEGVLSQLGVPMADEPDDAPKSTTADSKTTANDPAKDEEPSGAKSEEPRRGASVDALAAVISLRSKEVAEHGNTA